MQLGTKAISIEGSDLRDALDIAEINPLTDARWEVLAGHHADSSVFHRVEWLRALAACYGYEPVVFSYCKPNRPLTNGIVGCKIRSSLTGARYVSLPFSDHCEPLVEHPEQFGGLVSALEHKVGKDGCKYVEFRPLRRRPDTAPHFAISNTYWFHRLDLQQPEEKLFKTFHKDCVQRKIRRAERELLRYEDGRSDELLGDFYKLMILTRRRQYLPPQPLRWFRSLIHAFETGLKIRVAYKGAIPIASILTINHRKTMVYKYGCSDARFNNLGGTPLLFWRAIQEAKASGLEELDMGRSDLDNPGLAAFKEHWGAQRQTLNYWRYPAKATKAHPEQAIHYAKKLISVAPDACLVLLGNLLYRHIG